MATPPMSTQVHGFRRNGEILVYLMPVGNIPAHLYEEYVLMLQESSVIPMSSLTRPGGYSAELSPFRSLAWESSTNLVYRFEETTKTISVACEEVHASNRPLGIIGICHCPHTSNLRQAYLHFEQAVARYPSAIVHKCYAFEHAFGAGTLEDVSTLEDLIMFPLAAPLSDGHTTVSLHLQVVLDAMTVTILMSLESSIRSALRQHQQTAESISDSGFGLLSTQIDPLHETTIQSSVPLHLSQNGSSTNVTRTSSGNAIPTVPALEKDARTRKRTILRQEKLIGDYSILVGCYEDAIDHYITAIEGLREEEKRTSATYGDSLWLAAALEGYITGLYLTMFHLAKGSMKFNVEIVEKASEAIGLYSKIRCVGLESRLILAMGWYYVEVAARSTKLKGLADEAEWMRKLCMDTHSRLLASFPDSNQTQRMEYLLEMGRQSHEMKYFRKETLYLHEVATSLLCRHRQAPNSATDLQAAYLLEQLAVKLNQDHGEWWLELRFASLRQLIILARKLHLSDSIVRHTLQLLKVLSTCKITMEMSGIDIACTWNESHSSSYTDTMTSTTDRNGLHLKPSIYFNPPNSIEKELKKGMNSLHGSYFKGLPNALTATQASSIVSQTPRLLATPRQLMSAVMNPTFNHSNEVIEEINEINETTEFVGHERSLNLHARDHIKQWQDACWLLLNEDTKSRTDSILPLHGICVVKKFQPQSNRTFQTSEIIEKMISTTTSAFYYNPFQSKATSTSRNRMQTIFPLHESITLELVLENPLEISIFIPRVSAYIENPKSGQIFSIPVKLEPRARNISFALRLRPLMEGELVLLGCYFHFKQQTMRYELQQPLVMQIVSPIPSIQIQEKNSVVSLLVDETKPFNMELYNTSGVDVAHLHLDLTIDRKTAGSHSASSSRVILNSIHPTTGSSDELTVSGLTIQWNSASLMEQMPIKAKSSMQLNLQLKATREDLMHVRVRLFCCNEATSSSIYREASSTITVSILPSPTIISTSVHPSVQGIQLHDVYNPSMHSTINLGHAHGKDAVLPQTALRIPLVSNRIEWFMQNGKSLPDEIQENSWTMSIEMDKNTLAMSMAVRLHEMYTIQFHLVRGRHANELRMIFDVIEESVDGNMRSGLGNIMVAGHLTPIFVDSSTHVVELMVLNHGIYYIHAHGSDGVNKMERRMRIQTIE